MTHVYTALCVPTPDSRGGPSFSFKEYYVSAPGPASTQQHYTAHALPVHATSSARGLLNHPSGHSSALSGLTHGLTRLDARNSRNLLLSLY